MWLPDDMDAALAYMDWLADSETERCAQCGTRPDDWIDPDTGKTLRDPAWKAEVRECEGCATLADTDGDIDDKDRGFKRAVLVPNLGDDDDDDGWLHPVDDDVEP